MTSYQNDDLQYKLIGETWYLKLHPFWQHPHLIICH